MCPNIRPGIGNKTTAANIHVIGRYSWARPSVVRVRSSSFVGFPLVGVARSQDFCCCGCAASTVVAVHDCGGP